jgi:putative hydrolase of the HAD superfamily
MRFAGHAFVDWDDTVAENIRYFNMTEEANSTLIARLTGFTPDFVLKRGREHDVAVARRMGLVRDSLWTAWVECYREMCGQKGLAPDAATEEAIRRSCQMPYEVRQELLPGAPEMLAWLHERGFEVTIWTAGDQDVQSRKIAESGLAHLVHRTQIVPDKTPERLSLAMGEREPGACFVLGNSIHSDIRPALAVGVLGVHIPTETWAYDHGRLDLSDPNYHQIDRITDLPAALTSRFRLAV